MEGREKGNVTSLASLISVEEAQRAVKRVEDSIAEHQKELDQLHHFISENKSLVNLVKKLPDELNHDIMVPFGKAAFFPGRLIHTNEFTVLLGEGYYVQRTSKQTVEVLQRRGKVLDSQVDSLKAMMLDLKAEASFFGSTAAEAAEGVVEIREDYVEESPTQSTSSEADLGKLDKHGSDEKDNVEVAAQDTEYARIMARLDELEKEELEAETDSDEDEKTSSEFGCSVNVRSLDQILKIAERHEPTPREFFEEASSRNFSATAKPAVNKSQSQQKSTAQSSVTPKSAVNGSQSQQKSTAQSSVTPKPAVNASQSQQKSTAQSSNSNMQFKDIKAQSLSKDEYLRRENLARTDKPREKPLASVEKGKAGVLSSSKSEFVQIDKDKAAKHDSEEEFDSSKAFTCCIIERAHGINSGLDGKPTALSESTGTNPSRPVSRFKLQRGGR